MFSKALVLALAFVGAQAFTPLGGRAMAPRTASKTVVQGTFVEEFKFKKFFNRFTFKSFADCIVAAGLEDEIAAMGGEVTLFAPTDAAFADLGADGLAELMGDKAKAEVTLFAPIDAAFADLGADGLAELMGDKAKLTSMVKFHMLAGKQLGPSFRNDNEKKLTTLQGSDLVVDSDGKSAFVNDAKVETYDVETDEGLFHIIDW
eukprot:CAMPEP_0171621764 /NCGR_PEP_ID=MMETSP0990-20121206/16813_1 /TAXON_ID=483369 /ORGANISM="non described non described, Strain CCMP2098" /LENGTH=203 /DNA_ID=CAMNT_0012187375 /DNA_START=215 /DNA_END=822 /DNA_ORIENTATION=-